MDALHCKSVEGVLKEATMIALFYSLVRLMLCEAAKRHGVSVEQIRFTDPDAPGLAHADLNAPLPKLNINPKRPDRRDKRRLRQYDYLK